MPSVFSGLERRDGEVMDMDDEDALLEFGFLLNVLQFFQDIVWVGDLDAPPTGTCDDNVPAPKRGRRRKRQEASPQKPSPQNNNTNVPDAHAEQKVRLELEQESERLEKEKVRDARACLTHTICDAPYY